MTNLKMENCGIANPEIGDLVMSPLGSLGMVIEIDVRRGYIGPFGTKIEWYHKLISSERVCYTMPTIHAYRRNYLLWKAREESNG
jgi:hypothetical protein